MCSQSFFFLFDRILLVSKDSGHLHLATIEMLREQLWCMMYQEGKLLTKCSCGLMNLTPTQPKEIL